MVDVVRVVDSLQAGFRDTLLEVTRRSERATAQAAQQAIDLQEAFQSSTTREDGDARFQAVTTLEIKRHLPVIGDEDPDLARHNEEFDMHIATQNTGGRKMRAVDELLQYSNSLKAGSIRRRTLENEKRRAKMEGRLPKEARAVLEEIRAMLLPVIWETSMQKCNRIERSLEELEQGGRSHALFRVNWETILMDYKESDLTFPDPQALFRKYLNKINQGTREKIMQREWKLDGPDKPLRSMKTYQDIALAIGLLQEQTADIKAASASPYDNIHAVDQVVPRP
jgi:hypothetical protein